MYCYDTLTVISSLISHFFHSLTFLLLCNPTLQELLIISFIFLFSVGTHPAEESWQKYSSNLTSVNIGFQNFSEIIFIFPLREKMLTQILEIVYEAGFVEDKMALET